MSDAPSQELLESVATDLAVDPSFVEKDWHATQIIARIAERESNELAPVFSGGTSLSKGFHLIQRFSEDIDFKLLLPGPRIHRDARRNYRATLIDAIRADAAWTLSEHDILVADQGRFLRCDVAYSPIYTPSEPLRAYIRLEMTLRAPALPPEQKALAIAGGRGTGESPGNSQYPLRHANGDRRGQTQRPHLADTVAASWSG